MSQQNKSQLDQAQSFVESGKFDQAVNVYLNILSDDSSDLDALMGLGNCYLQLGDVSKAFEQFSTGRQLAPEATDFAFQYANTLVLGGYQKEALAELQRATGLCGNDPLFCLEIARLLIKLGEAQGALGILDRLEELTPDGQVLMARAFCLQGEFSDAIAILHRLRQELPEVAIFANELSLAAAYLGDYRLAVTNYEDYLNLSEPKSSDYLRFADLLLKTKNLERAEIALEQAKGEHTDLPGWFFVQAQINRLKGDYLNAIESCLTTLKLQPTNAYAWSMLIELVNKEDLLEHTDQLKTLLDKELFSTSHDKSQALFAMARSFERQDDVSSSCNYLRKANSEVSKRLKLSGKAYIRKDYENYVTDMISLFDKEFFQKTGTNHGASFGRPIFILGLVRSGTTLVERLISQSNSVLSGGEQEAVPLVLDEYRRQHEMGNIGSIKQLNANEWSNLAVACQSRYTCDVNGVYTCLLYTSPSPRDLSTSRMPSSA